MLANQLGALAADRLWFVSELNKEIETMAGMAGEIIGLYGQEDIVSLSRMPCAGLNGHDHVMMAAAGIVVEDAEA